LHRACAAFGTAAGGAYLIEEILDFSLLNGTMAAKRQFHGANQRDLNFFLLNQLPP
jgi:hypothetical protein